MKSLNSIGIVDDDPIMVFGIKVMIKNLGLCLETKVWNNGREAIDGLQQLSKNGEPMPKIILLDLSMPVMDGWGFLEAFQMAAIPDKETIEINVLSSSINPTDKERALKFRIVKDYHVKPLSELSLRKIVFPEY